MNFSMSSPTHQTDSTLNIRIKVNVENNVIFLGCDGFQSEAFMPTINDGRLAIINVIPERRCKCIKTSHIVTKNSKPAFSPIRTSTPKKRCNNAFETLLQMLDESNEERAGQGGVALSQQTTPQLARCAAERTNAVSSQLRQIIKTPITQMQQSKDSIPATMQIVQLSESLTSNATSLSSVSCPNRNRQADSLSEMEFPIIASPSKDEWSGMYDVPKRTYARRSYSPNSSFSSNTPSRKETLHKFLQQSTEGIITKKKVAIKSRKKSTRRKFDEKIVLSPERLKRQMQVQENLPEKCDKMRQEYKKRGIVDAKKLAFDLITAPTIQSKCLSTKILQQFHARCLDKGSSTYPKYKKLAKLAIEEGENSDVVSQGGLTFSILELDPTPSSLVTMITAEDFW